MMDGNALLDALPLACRARLARHMRVADLLQGQVLHRPGEPIGAVFFPLDCLISVTVTVDGEQTVEAGAVGSREMVGLAALAGGRETDNTQYVCQVAGRAVELAAQPLLAEFDRERPVRDVLLRYAQAYVAQLSQNVACNRVHSVDQRLAQWLLESRDRLRAADIGLTHEFVSQMLGIRRAGVTEALGRFEDRGLVRCGRGRIRVTDHDGLGLASCGCFRALRKEYDRLLSRPEA